MSEIIKLPSYQKNSCKGTLVICSIIFHIQFLTSKHGNRIHSLFPNRNLHNCSPVLYGNAMYRTSDASGRTRDATCSAIHLSPCLSSSASSAFFPTWGPPTGGAARSSALATREDHEPSQRRLVEFRTSPQRWKAEVTSLSGGAQIPRSW